MAIIQGMADEDKKKQISFQRYKDSNFTFLKIKKLLRAAFFKVGKTSLFDSKYPVPSSSASPSTSGEALRQMVNLASISSPSILQGTRSNGTKLPNLNKVPSSPQMVQDGGLQTAYKNKSRS